MYEIESTKNVLKPTANLKFCLLWQNLTQGCHMFNYEVNSFACYT